MASSVTVSPAISIRTPVRIGSVSSRLAATVTWATAELNTSDDTVPASAGISGRAGYSSTGIVIRVNRLAPQVSTIFAPSWASSTGLSGRLRQMSASSRPDTSAWPGSLTSAGTSTLAETS